MFSRRFLAGASGHFLLACGIAGIGVSCLLGSSTDSQPAASTSPRPTFAALGAGRCAAAACHGGPEGQGTHQSEYSIWAKFDKHASAYSVLSNDRSKQIEAILRPNEKILAQKDSLCLNCHALEHASESGHPEANIDGVSCESCHGRSEVWLNQHYLSYWKEAPAKTKEAMGFIDTHDLLQRGKACAACHIGNGSKEVNHDLIAAGHPRLQFEYSAYLAMETKHWDAAEEKRRIPDLEIRAWALGQLLSAQAAFELLATRAQVDPAPQSSESKRPWPEFTEYDCFSCHHDLKSTSWRADERIRADAKAGLKLPTRPVGRLDWGIWCRASLPQALAVCKPADREEVNKAVSDLEKKMGVPGDRRGIKEAAQTAANSLSAAARALASEKGDSAIFNNLIDALQHPNDNQGELTWDRATQMYLGLAAAVNAQNDREPNRRDSQFEQRVRAIANVLKFPGNPKDNNQFDSPNNFDLASVRDAFRNLGSRTSK